MSSTDSDPGDVRWIGARIDPETKRRAKMRYAQLGYNNLSEYFRALIQDDLDDADLPLE